MSHCHLQPGRLVAFSSRSPLLAVSMTNRTIEVWDWVRGSRLKVLRTANGQGWWAATMAFSPDGSILASGSFDGTARLWDIERGVEIGTLLSHPTVLDLAFSPDGRTLATSGGDLTVRLWSVNTKQEMISFSDLTDAAGTLLFSPDGRFLAAGLPADRAAGGPIRIWEAPTFEDIHKAANSVRRFAPD